MKKIILTLTLAMALASCGGGSDGGSPVVDQFDEPSIENITEGTGTAMATKDLAEIEDLVREVVYQIAYQKMNSKQDNMSVDETYAQTSACSTGGYTYWMGTPMVEDEGKGVITVSDPEGGSFKISKTARLYHQETNLTGNFAEYQNPKVYLTDKDITVSGDADLQDAMDVSGDINAACADLENGTKYATGMTMSKDLAGGFSISGDIAGALTFGVYMTETYTSPTQTSPAVFVYNGSATFKSGDITSTCAITASARPNSYDEISIICQ